MAVKLYFLKSKSTTDLYVHLQKRTYVMKHGKIGACLFNTAAALRITKENPGLELEALDDTKEIINISNN